MAISKPTHLGECYDEVVIDVDGGVKVESHGFTGGECQNSTRHLEQALGAVIERRGKDDPYGGSYQQTG